MTQAVPDNNNNLIYIISSNSIWIQYKKYNITICIDLVSSIYVVNMN